MLNRKYKLFTLFLALAITAVMTAPAYAASPVNVAKRGLIGVPCVDAPPASEADSTNTVTRDINGDGRADLVIKCSRFSSPVRASYVVLLRNSANNGFNKGIVVPNVLKTGSCGIGSFEISDVNADGRPDIISDDCGGVHVYLQRAKRGTFEPGYLLPQGECYGDAALKDISGDGVLDIVRICGPEGGKVIVANGAKPFQAASATQVLPTVAGVPGPRTEGSPSCVVQFMQEVGVNDENADGRLDIVALCTIESEYYYAGDEAEAEEELFFPSSRYLLRWMQQADGSFVASSSKLPAVPGDTADGELSCSGERFADLDSDGQLDTLLSCRGMTVDGVKNVEGVVWLDTRADGQVELLQQLVHPTYKRNAGCALSDRGVAGDPQSFMTDIDNDGRQDLLMACENANVSKAAPNAGAVAVFTRAAGSSTFTPITVPLSVTKDSTCGMQVYTPDLDEDGKADLVVSCSNAKVAGQSWAGQVFVFRGGAPLTAANRTRFTASKPVMGGWFSSAMSFANIDGQKGLEMVVDGNRSRGTIEVVGARGNGPMLPKLAVSRIMPPKTKLAQIKKKGALTLMIKSVAPKQYASVTLQVSPAVAKKLRANYPKGENPVTIGNGTTFQAKKVGSTPVMISMWYSMDRVSKKTFPQGIPVTARVRIARADGASTVAVRSFKLQW